MVIVFALISLELVYLCRLALTQDVTVGIYWIYLCLYWIQCITSVVLAILIATNKNEDGPTFLVKVRVYENCVSDKLSDFHCKKIMKLHCTNLFTLLKRWQNCFQTSGASFLSFPLPACWEGGWVKAGLRSREDLVKEGRGQKGETVWPLLPQLSLLTSVQNYCSCYHFLARLHKFIKLNYFICILSLFFFVL